MIGNRLWALAVPAALAMTFAMLCSAPPALAAKLDGSWSMVAVTTSGHCGTIRIGLGINRGRIYSTSGAFAFYPIQLAGRVSASGHAKMKAVAGPRTAHGSGHFNRVRGSGKWSGTGPSGVCSGHWTAIRG